MLLRNELDKEEDSHAEASGKGGIYSFQRSQQRFYFSRPGCFKLSISEISHRQVPKSSQYCHVERSRGTSHGALSGSKTIQYVSYGLCEISRDYLHSASIASCSASKRFIWYHAALTSYYQTHGWFRCSWYLATNEVSAS
jgi:hypothetical protein